MDSQDFARAVEAYGSRLYRLAGRIAPPGVDPDDLVQETFERAWRNRDRFRSEASVATWLHSIMLNRARDYTRAWMRARHRVAERFGSEAGLLDVNIEDPAEVVARAEREEDLRAALAQLPPPERSVVALHDGEGFPAATIAEMLGCSESAAHKRIQRGRFRLARLLDVPHQGTPPPLSCRVARRSASAYLDGELPSVAARDVEQHLSDCLHCPPVMQAIIGIRGALSSPPARPMPASLLDRLRQTVNLEGKATP
jgi:RNA polymerase sigma-70 factor (ECF subfamily)